MVLSEVQTGASNCFLSLFVKTQKLHRKHDTQVRFPGSGGANDFASFCWKIMVITPQDAKRFVAEVDFITSPGYLDGPGDSREGRVVGQHRPL